jgi:hypothetical protein
MIDVPSGGVKRSRGFQTAAAGFMIDAEPVYTATGASEIDDYPTREIDA